MNAYELAEMRRTLNQRGYNHWITRTHQNPARYVCYDETDTVQMVIRRAMYHPAWENGHAGHYGTLFQYETANQALVDGLDRTEAKKEIAGGRRARQQRNKFNRTRIGAIAGYAAAATLIVAAAVCATHSPFIFFLIALGIPIAATAAAMAHITHHITGQEMQP